MNIVIVCDWAYAGGGAEKVAVDSAVALSRLGHSVHFIAAVGPPATELLNSAVVLHLTGQQELRNKAPLDLVTSGLWSTHSRKMTAEVLVALPAGDTVIHLHAWQRALTASTVQACTRSGHPVVLTAHEYGAACPNQGFFDYQRREICERKALGWDCLTTHCDTRSYAHKVWRTGRIVLQRLSASFPTAVKDVIYLSELSRQVLAPYFSTDARWHAVRNAMSLVQGPRVASESNGHLLFVGRLSFEKGADIFCRAAALADVSAVIVGDGPAAAELRQQFPAARFTGWCDADGVRAQLQHARALVLPSRWYEGQPLVVQEALSMGVPVLVSDRTGAREVVDHRETGLHFRHMDEVALAEAMQALADFKLVRAMSEQAYIRYWRNPQTMASHCDELVTVYRQALAGVGQRRVAA